MTSSSIYSHQQLNIYEPLPNGPHIRVLILEPGRRRQPIRCRLKIVNLEEKPDFEAISYVWGHGIKRKKVFCNGTRVKITANLLQALIAVRHPSRQRTVWTDSISVNQSDNEEKSLQVALMGPIYNRARRVLIHLAGDDKGHAYGAATFISEKVALIRQGCREDPEAVSYQSAEEIQLLTEDPRFQSVNYLTNHPWFLRGWVIQEAVLAQDTVVVWGSRRISRLESLMIYQDWLFRGVWGLQAARKHNINPVTLLSDLYRYRYRDVAQTLGYGLDTRPNFLEVLHLARSSQLEDPRDRVYAFLYLDRLENPLEIAIDVKATLAIQPDYSKPVAEVYADFVRGITKTGDIEWLHYVQHTPASLVERGFASWIPRWDVHEHITLRTGLDLPIFQSCHPTRDNRRHESARFDGNCLIVQGVLFDRVRTCQRYAPARRCNITLNDVVSFWRMARTFDLGSAYPSQHLGLALLYTITMGFFGFQIPPFSDWPEKMEQCDPMDPIFLRHRNTGEEITYDPRLEPEHSEARGIELTWFTLV